MAIPAHAIEPLSEMEKAIMIRCVAEHADKEIAEMMGIAVSMIFRFGKPTYSARSVIGR